MSRVAESVESSESSSTVSQSVESVVVLVAAPEWEFLPCSCVLRSSQQHSSLVAIVPPAGPPYM
jgi:hypothetical protein